MAICQARIGGTEAPCTNMPFSLSASGVASFSLRRSCADDCRQVQNAFNVWTDPEGFSKPLITLPVYNLVIDQRRAGSVELLLVGRGTFEVTVKSSSPDVAFTSVSLLPEGTRDVMYWERCPRWTMQATGGVFSGTHSPLSCAVLRIEYTPAEQAPDDDRFVIKCRSEQVCKTDWMSVFRSEPPIRCN
jgi:hypothetical protein